MKNLILHPLLGALFFSCAFAFTSCQQDAEDVMLPYIEPTNAISSQGGMVSAFDGNVVLSFPEGAIDYTVDFSVKICEVNGSCPYLLKTISIEPFFMTFKKPVELSIRYDGCLCNGNAAICPGICINVLNWNSPQDFIDQLTPKNCNCILNDMYNTIDLVIYQTGVFAVNRQNKMN
jgi:hypothetical protein